LIVVGTVAPGERPGGGSGVGELPTNGGFSRGDAGHKRRSDDLRGILGNLGKEVARAGSEVIGQDDVGGVDGVFEPSELCYGRAGDCRCYRLVASLTLNADELVRCGVDRGLAGVGTRFNGGRQCEGKIAQRIHRGNFSDPDARKQIGAVHQKVIPDLGIVCDPVGERSGKIDDDSA
jgi:hypothetical protein